MKKLDLFTGEPFITKDVTEQLSPNTKKIIVGVITKDEDMRREVLSAICQDDEVRVAIAKSILACNATDVGLNSPGTVAEFFLRLRDRKPKRRAS